MTTTETANAITAKLTEIEALETAYVQAVATRDAAVQAADAALQTLNAAQKQLSGLIDALKSAAPVDTVWAREIKR